LEETNRARIEEQKKKAEEEKQQREEAERKKKEDMETRRNEQIAAASIRRVIQKLKIIKPENFELVAKELAEAKEKHLETCGSLKELVVGEVDKAVEAAQEAKRVEEERKAEIERKKQEAIEKGKASIVELEGMVDSAVAACEKLKTATAEFTGKDVAALTVKSAEEMAQAIEEVGKEAKEKHKACTEFVMKKGQEMKVVDTLEKKKAAEEQAAKAAKAAEEKAAEGAEEKAAEGEEDKKEDKKEDPNKEERPSLSRLLLKVGETGKIIDATVREATEAKTKTLKKLEAKAKMDAAASVFAKYDKDKDQFLNKKEVTAYAKGEFKFNLTTPALDFIWRVVVGDGKGVAKKDFQSLKVAVGVQREKVQDEARKEARIAKEKAIAAKKEELQKQIDGVTKEVEAAEAKLQAAEKASTLNRAKDQSIPHLRALADAAETGGEETKEAVTTAAEAVAGLARDKQDEDLADELVKWLALAEKTVKMRMMKFEGRLKKLKTNAENYRKEAQRKEDSSKPKEEKEEKEEPPEKKAKVEDAENAEKEDSSNKEEKEEPPTKKAKVEDAENKEKEDEQKTTDG